MKADYRAPECYFNEENQVWIVTMSIGGVRYQAEIGAASDSSEYAVLARAQKQVMEEHRRRNDTALMGEN